MADCAGTWLPVRGAPAEIEAAPKTPRAARRRGSPEPSGVIEDGPNTDRCGGPDFRSWHDPSRSATRPGGRSGRHHCRWDTRSRRGRLRPGDARRKNNNNVCDGKNWCRDRTETCGQAGDTASAWWTIRGSTSAPSSSSRLRPARSVDRPTAPTAAVCRRGWRRSLQQRTRRLRVRLRSQSLKRVVRGTLGRDECYPMPLTVHAVRVSIRPGHIAALGARSRVLAG